MAITQSRLLNKKILSLVWVILWGCLIVAWRTIVVVQIVRTALALALIGIFGVALLLLWQPKIARYSYCCFLIFIFSFVLLPGRNSDPEVVRKEYVRQILKYEGTPYVYGGEDRRGIDCSGLVRCGLLNANFICGISTLNSSLIREGIFLWWHDASAKELKEGYRNKTSPLFTAAGLGEIDYALMKPGDLAIKADGTHVLVFIGERTWMEADPDKMVVTKFTVTEQNKANYNSPIQIVRWKQLEN